MGDGDDQRVVNQNRLAHDRGSCHWGFMAHPQHGFPRAGGFLLALSILIGPVIGALFGEPSLGFIVGLGIGLLLVLLVWIRERANRP